MLHSSPQKLVLASLLFASLTTPVLASSLPSPVAPQDQSKFQVLKAAAPTLNPKVLKLALKAYDKARAKGYDDKKILSVIDYSLPTTHKALWVFDLNSDKLLYHTYVAHGKNSGNLVATKFSNAHNSKQSSLGLYLTGQTYHGRDGLAMRLNGLSKNFNTNAYSRAVVMHGAPYVSQAFVDQNHRLGRSWGCPAVSHSMIKPITNTIKNGTLIFAYGNDENWLKNDPFIAA